MTSHGIKTKGFHFRKSWSGPCPFLLKHREVGGSIWKNYFHFCAIGWTITSTWINSKSYQNSNLKQLIWWHKNRKLVDILGSVITVLFLKSEVTVCISSDQIKRILRNVASPSSSSSSSWASCSLISRSS